MKLSDTIIVHPTAENFKALMAFITALKINFELPSNSNALTFTSDDSIIELLDKRAQTSNEDYLSIEESNLRLNEL